jgi:hypothetical protein
LRALHRPRTAAGRFLTFAFITCLLFASSPALAAAQSTGVGLERLASAPPRTGQLATKTPTADTNDSASAGGTGLDGNVYTGVNVPFSVTFDDAVWNDVEAYDPEEGYEGFSINSDNSIGIIEALAEITELNDCVSSSLEGLASQSSFSNIHEAPELDAPVSAKGAVQMMFTMDVSNEQGTRPFTGYIECRVLIKDAMILRAELAAPDSVFDEAFPTWQPLLDGIKIDKAAASAYPTPTPNATPAADEDEDIQNVVGDTYTSPVFGFSVSWPKAWEPTIAEYDPEDEGDWLWVGNENDDTDLMLFSGSVDVEPHTAEECLTSSESLYLNSDLYTNPELMTDADGNPIREVTDTTAFALYSFVFQYKDGSTVDEVGYLFCELDPAGTFILDFTFETTAELYASGAKEEFQAVLDSVEFA